VAELKAAGHRLHYEWFGAKAATPTLVLLHEGLGCVELWRDWPERLARESGLGVLAYSRWGYGKSDPVTPPRPLHYMQDEARDSVAAVLERAGVERCILVGHSDGASIALAHVGGPTRHASIRGLVVMAPHVFCEELSVQSIARAKQAYERGELKERLRKYHGDNVDGAFWGWNRAWLDPEFMKWNIESFLPGIDLPVLAIQGAEDQYGTLKQLDAIAAQVKGPFERLVLEHCEHSPHRDQPEATTKAIVTFAKALR
jgi:pimeloyl-ACP methyl ester carboxylesterase